MNKADSIRKFDNEQMAVFLTETIVYFCVNMPKSFDFMKHKEEIKEIIKEYLERNE